MSTRFKTPLLIALVLMLLLSACGDDDLDSGGVKSGSNTPGGSDTGSSETDADSDDADDAGPVDERCEGKTAGSGCELPSASGVCIRGQCQFLACETGFRDCDDLAENGCETDVTRLDSCGACGVACGDAESCQLSSAGWVCSSTPVCPAGEFDLDGDSENGCEWLFESVEEDVLEPVSADPQTAASESTTAFSVAGVSDEGRIVTRTGTSTPPEPLSLSADDARAVEAVVIDDLVAVAWGDALTVSSADGSSASDGSFTPDCPDTSDPRCDFRGLSVDGTSTLFAVDGRRVLAVDFGPACADDAGAESAARQICSVPRASFEHADYLSGFFPTDNFDGQQAPEFSPVGATYLAASDLLAVFTRRGVVLLRPTDDDFEPLTRLERQDAAGSPFVAGTAVDDSADAHIYLLREDGTLRSLRLAQTEQGVSIEPAAADIGLNTRSDADAHPTLAAGQDGVVLVSGGRRAWLVRPATRSGRIVPLDPPVDFHTDGQTIFGTAKAASGEAAFAVLYFEFGRYYLQRVVREEQ